jgi:sugar O-acyltransferase (sialic acid O-acetyltransferase NeuD family)
MKNIVVLGGGGHGKVVVDIITKEQKYKLIGILDSDLPIGEGMLDHKIIGRESELPVLSAQWDLHGMIIALGDNWSRSLTVERIRRVVPRLMFVNAIHPSAQIAQEVAMGVGNVIMAGCVINSGTRLGDFCICNTNCSIDHDCTVADFVSFGPNSCAGGKVQVGAYSAIGLGTNIIQKIKIGEHTVVGAGSTVVRDLPSNVVAYGTPARPRRARPIGEEYL